MAKQRHAGSLQRTVYTVTGSPRHLDKTHGSHNGRLGSWPHLSDALDRPAHLRDVTRERPDKPRRSGHRRLGARQIRTSIGKHRDGAPLSTPRWDVRVEMENPISHEHLFVDVSVTARDEGEAARLACDLAEYLRPAVSVGATAQRR